MKRKLFLWARMLLIECAAFSALYAWQVRGFNPAGNVFRFWIGFLCASAIAFLIAPPKYSADLYEPARVRVSAAFDIILIISMAWFGLIWMSSFYTFAVLCSASYRSRCLAMKPEAP